MPTDLIASTIADFESYTADAKKAMDSVDVNGPLYLILEGVYHDRKSAEDQIRSALSGIRQAVLTEVGEALAQELPDLVPVFKVVQRLREKA